MFSYGLLYVGLTAVCLALIYMFHESEESKINTLSVKVSECFSNHMKVMRAMMDLSTKVELMSGEVAGIRDSAFIVIAQTKKACEDVSHVQDHCAKLRQSQISLQEKLSKKRPLLKFEGPLQVEIYTPSKNLGRKKSKSGGK